MKKRFILLLIGVFLLVSGCGNAPEDTVSPDSGNERLSFETNGTQEPIIRPYEIAAIAVYNQIGDAVDLSVAQSQELLNLFSEAESQELLYPTHLQAQTSDPVYILRISFSDGQEDVLYSTERGAQCFYRLTETYGEQGDQGYVLAENPLLEGFFQKLGL